MGSCPIQQRTDSPTRPPLRLPRKRSAPAQEIAKGDNSIAGLAQGYKRRPTLPSPSRRQSMTQAPSPSSSPPARPLDAFRTLPASYDTCVFPLPIPPSCASARAFSDPRFPRLRQSPTLG
jgi:hypothetical protein